MKMEIKKKPSGKGIDISSKHRQLALELTSLCLLGVMSVAALITALGYDFSSSRPLFVILLPLIVLIAVQLLRIVRAPGADEVIDIVKAAVAGKIADFSSAIEFTIILLLLLFTIYILGHYAALCLAMFYLIRMHGGESLKISILTPLITCILLFGLFDAVFGIELFQGQVYRYFAGYKIW